MERGSSERSEKAVGKQRGCLADWNYASGMNNEKFVASYVLNLWDLQKQPFENRQAAGVAGILPGSENFGFSVVTAGNVVFIAATKDEKPRGASTSSLAKYHGKHRSRPQGVRCHCVRRWRQAAD